MKLSLYPFYEYPFPITYFFMSPDITRKQIGYTAAIDKFRRFSAYAMLKIPCVPGSTNERMNTASIEHENNHKL